MTVHLANGGRLRVLANGSVEYRRGRERNVSPGRGSYAENIAWLESMAYGPAVLHITRKG